MHDTVSSTFTIQNHVFTANPLEPGLYPVATPIGNLGDISIRALETLAGCSLIACEDTRTSGVLLKRYGIQRPKISYTEHNANSRGGELLDRVAAGEAVALISDAGTPLVSDPGSRLVAEAVERGLRVTPIPGASAPLAALVGSGLPSENFRFVGFLPTKTKAREQVFQSFQSDPATLIFFESPARVAASLHNAASILGPQRRACIGRELTKMYETFHRGTLEQLALEFDAMGQAKGERVKGEIVMLIAGREQVEVSDADVQTLLIEALSNLKPGDAASEISRQTGRSRQELYKLALALKR